MTETLWPDHHADYAGWKRPIDETDYAAQWSPRKKAGYFLALAVISWILFLSPLLLFS